MTESMSPLRAARLTRAWSQVRAAEEIAELARARGIAVAAPVSLKTQLSRWENQHALPEEHYRALLCALYDTTEADLGFADVASPDERSESPVEALRDALNRADSIDGEAIELIRSQLETVRQLDHRLGRSAAEDSAKSILSIVIDRWRHCANRAVRRSLALLTVDSALLCAEQALDRTRVDEAWHHWETSKSAAHDAEVPELASYAMLRQAWALVGMGEYRAAGELILDAGSATEPNPLWPWVLAARGYAHAARGDATASDEAFAGVERRLSARVELDVAEVRIPILGYDVADMHRDRGHALLTLGENAQAVSSLESALNDARQSTRELAALHVDLAYAFAGLGRADAAASHAGKARAIASRTGCLSATARLDERLGPVLSEPPMPSGPPVRSGTGRGIRR
ncbi:MAG TPA: hypothetical protein VFE65_10170 [Pseudonocardia sp.]|nr:hypothetical protein [Pseudonocardia sp.]